MKRPTAEQCENQELISEDEFYSNYAMWYPQMGGYVSECVVQIPRLDPDGCFEAFVWSDGEFPFSEEAGPPSHIHHCAPEQFVYFGNSVIELRKKSQKDSK